MMSLARRFYSTEIRLGRLRSTIISPSQYASRRYALSERAVFSWRRFRWQVPTTATWGRLLLVSAALASALGLVYLKALQRARVNTLQAVQQQEAELQTHQEQLLIDHNIQIATARIQALAQSELGMVLPDAKDILTLKIKRASSRLKDARVNH